MQSHTFHAAGDVDWVAFEGAAETEYLVEALTPADSVADMVLEVYQACDGSPDDGQDPTFSPDVRLQFEAPATGTYYLKLRNSDQSAAGQDVAYDLSVRALGDEATPGALIVVAGKLHSNDPLQGHIHNVTNNVYNLFLAHGYTDQRSYYLATDESIDADDDGTPDVDGLASPQNLEEAITEWAVTQVDAKQALTLYLTDHGGIDRFYLNGASQTITPSELDGWLDELEAALPGIKINVIVETCHSGSFIAPSQSISPPYRVIMTSTAVYRLARTLRKMAPSSQMPSWRLCGVG